MPSLKLHKEHGVNPTIPQCFYCGEDKNELVLLGAAYKGEAPRSLCLNYEPCDNCQEQMQRGILIVACTEIKPDDGRPEIQEGLYPTGEWIVITEEAARRCFTPSDILDQVLKHRKTLMDKATFELLKSNAS